MTTPVRVCRCGHDVKNHVSVERPDGAMKINYLECVDCDCDNYEIAYNYYDAIYFFCKKGKGRKK